MADMNFSEVLHNPHFNQFVALLRVAMSQHWRMRHPEVPSVRGTLEYRLSKLHHNLNQPSIQHDFIAEWTNLFTSVVEADPKLYYRVEDMDWLISVLDGEDATTILSMLFAASFSPTVFVTPAQVAEATSTHESGWRNKCADGEIIGAFKAGKQWLIPVTALRAYGVDVGLQGQEEAIS